MTQTDPFETQNRVAFLTAEEKSYLHDTLNHLKRCRGRSCTLNRHINQSQANQQAPQLPNLKPNGGMGGVANNNNNNGNGKRKPDLSSGK